MSTQKVVDGLERLTGFRDRKLIQQSLVNTLLELVPSYGHRLYDVKWKQDGLDVELLVEAIKPEISSSAEISEPLMVIMRQSIESRQAIKSESDHGVTVVIPLRIQGELGVEVLVQECIKLDDEQSELTHGLLHIYSNFLSLVKEHIHDHLTGLLNRATLDQKINNIINHTGPVAGRRRKEPDYWLAVIDIDRFKIINDNHGHLFGDEVLILLAQLMKETFRDVDNCFRYGGEEFLVLLQVEDGLQAKAACQRFCDAVASHRFPQDLSVTVSIGFVQITDQENVSSIITQADRALYFSKQNGRNQSNSFEELVAAGKLLFGPKADDGVDIF
ncbi:GGDEF domain-containing protein [Oceanicoccus sp. KOV_DT_Chl]|uniref:GGDEF domain-containing protein n=1 Tax=Oceanicoccus sp. KOV_DT_Chl TaxID=1904639 RepID=UPI000C79FA50|nr:GGDEF domain-containing protein [Oceanicoccus sp. KOV_DT_Chl]